MWKSTSELNYPEDIVGDLANLHAIEQTQLWGECRVDGVGRPIFDFHTGELCRGNGGNTQTPSAEHCGAGGGVNCAGGGVYRVTSDYFYDRDGCPNACVRPTAKPTKKPTTPYPTRSDYGTCPRLEPANECPAKISELPVCSDPCMCKGMRGPV